MQATPITFPKQQQQRQASGSGFQATISPSPRQWRGSPMSYKMYGSLGNRFYPATSPGTLMGPLDPNDYKVPAGIASSIESERGRILRALNGDENLMFDDFQLQNYSCCGLELNDLHALLEHFEESHVVVLDSPNIGPTRYQPSQSAFDPDAMELDTDSGPSSSASSPPSTPPLASASAFDTSILRAGSSRMSNGSVFSNSPSRRGSPGARDEAFNGYSSYSEFSSLMPGTVPAPPAQSQPPPSNQKCIPPAMLFSPSTQNTPTGTPAGSRVPSPAPHHRPNVNVNRPHPVSGKQPKMGPSNMAYLPQSPADIQSHAPQASTTLSRPGASLVLAKPFRCPTEGCNKSYKQANGLKYHITHGQCNFQPRDPALDGLNDREADQKARPYVCQVGACVRRYKNMNGLRYHYQHSGAHGAVGLALLASGQHSLQTGVKDPSAELAPEQYQQQYQLHQQQMAEQHARGQAVNGSSHNPPPLVPYSHVKHQIPHHQLIPDSTAMRV